MSKQAVASATYSLFCEIAALITAEETDASIETAITPTIAINIPFLLSPPPKNINLNAIQLKL